MHGANDPTEPRHAAARAAQTRAAHARRRAAAAGQAAEQATTEYARGAHRRAADLHADIARHHERAARTLRMRAGESDAA